MRALALIVCLMFPLIARAGALAPTVGVGNWVLFPVGDTLGFDFCVVSMRNPRGTLFSVVITRDNRVRLLLRASAWQLQVGDRHPVDWTIDGGERGRGMAQVTSPTALRIAIAEEGLLLRDIRRQSRLSFQLPAGMLEFDLKGGDEAMDAVTQCTRDWMDREIRDRTANPVLRLILPQQEHDPAMLQRAGAFMADLRTRPDFADLSRTMLRGENGFPPDSPYDAMWGAASFEGAVRLLNGPSKTLDDITATIMRDDTIACQGRVSSSAKDVALKGLGMRRVHTQCGHDDPNAQTGPDDHSYYLLLQTDTLSALVVHRSAGHDPEDARSHDETLAQQAMQVLTLDPVPAEGE